MRRLWFPLVLFLSNLTFLLLDGSFIEETIQKMQLELLKLSHQNDKQQLEITMMKDLNEKQQLEMTTMKEKLDQNEKQPYVFVCAAQLSSRNSKVSTSLNYDTLQYSSTNVKDGGFDLCTGVFTSGHPGTYSATWSSLSSATGLGDFVVLSKNGREIPGSQCVWSQQGRTIFTELDKGDTLQLRYNGWSGYGIDRTTFCVSLVHAHETEKNIPEAVPVPGLSLKPLPAEAINYSIIYKLKISTDTMEPGDTNFDLALKMQNYIKTNYNQSITKELEDNHRQECSRSRKCKAPCNSQSLPRCEGACPFNLKTLDKCMKMPFGFVNDLEEEGYINPCFFLQFDLIDYWKPESYSGVPPDDIPWQQKMQLSDNWWRDSFPVNFDCIAKLVKEETDMFSQVVELINIPVSSPMYRDVKQYLEYFANNRELFEKLFEEGENLEKFYETSIYLKRNMYRTEGMKMYEKFQSLASLNAEDEEKAEWFAEFKDILYLELNQIVDLVRPVRYYHNLKKKQQDTLVQTIEDLREENNYTKISDTIIDVCNNMKLCNQTGPLFCEDCFSLFNDFLEGFDILNKFMKLEKQMENQDEKNEPEDMYFKVNEHLRLLSTIDNTHPHHVNPHHPKNYNPHPQKNTKVISYLEMFSKNKKLVDRLDEYGDDAIKFSFVKKYIVDYNKQQNNIDFTFYPNNQGIPSEYFPFVGQDYENPMVAFQLNLNTTELAPGQEIDVQCRAWYKGVVHTTTGKSSMVKFKIIFQ